MEEMTKEEAFKVLQDIISELLAVDDAEAGDTIKSLGGDSLDSVDIIAKIERRLGVKISDEKASEMYDLTLGEIAQEILTLPKEQKK